MPGRGNVRHGLAVRARSGPDRAGGRRGRLGGAGGQGRDGRARARARTRSSRRSPIRCAWRCAAGSLPPPGGELLEPLLGWPVPVAGRWSRRLRINVRFSRRGRRVLEPELLVIRDPLRLYSRELEGRGRRGGARASAGRAGDRARQRRRGRRRPGRARRAAEPVGEAARRLRGRARDRRAARRTARARPPRASTGRPSRARGEMLERRLVAELDSAPLIVMDPSAPASEEALDKAVRAAASLCVWLARNGGCAVLLPGDRRPIDIGHDLGAWPAVHVRLALVEEGAAPAGGVLGPRGGAVIWVTGADLRAHAARARAAARRVALRGRARRAPGRAARVRGGRLHRLPRRAGAARDRQPERGMSGVLGRTAGAGHRRRAARVGRQRARRRGGHARLARDAAGGVRRAGGLRRGALGDAGRGRRRSGRTLLVLLVATGGAAALGLLAPARRSRGRRCTRSPP